MLFSFLRKDLQKAINFHDILAVLQLYADGVDFTVPMPDSVSFLFPRLNVYDK